MTNVSYVAHHAPSGGRLTGGHNYVQDPGDAQILCDAILWLTRESDNPADECVLTVAVVRMTVTRSTFRMTIPSAKEELKNT